MKNFKGNLRYWPLVGYDLDLEPSKNDIHFIIPVVELALPKLESEIEYVDTYKRVYFLKEKISNRIYSQSFPDTKKNRQDSTALKELSEGKLVQDSQDEYPSEYFILKLKSTKKHLYAIQKSNDDLYLSKIFISDNGFDGDEDVKKIIIDVPNELINENICVEIEDIDDYEADVYIFIKEKKNIYTAKFLTESKECIFKPIFNEFSKEFFSPVSFCKYEKGVVIMDDSSKALCVLEYNIKKEKFTKRHTVPFDKIKKIYDAHKNPVETHLPPIGMSSFYVNYENIVCDLEVKNKKNISRIDLVLFYYNDGVWYWNYKMEKIESLIDNESGALPINEAVNEEKNLNEYRFIQLKKIHVFNNNCIIFTEETGNSFALLTPKLRKTWMLKNDKINIDYNKSADS